MYSEQLLTPYNLLIQPYYKANGNRDSWILKKTKRENEPVGCKQNEHLTNFFQDLYKKEGSYITLFTV